MDSFSDLVGSRRSDFDRIWPGQLHAVPKRLAYELGKLYSRPPVSSIAVLALSGYEQGLNIALSATPSTTIEELCALAADFGMSPHVRFSKGER